jgi:hypothetical protein
MARLNYRSVEKIMAGICKDSVPIYAHSRYEQDALFEKVKTFITSDKRLSTSSGSYGDTYEPSVKYINVIFKDYDKNFSPLPYIRINSSGCLSFKISGPKISCPLDFETLQQAIDEMFKLIELDKADKMKLQKIRDLKTSGIIGKLNEIAKEDGFKFHHEQTPTRVKVSIVLPKNKTLRIDVLFADFQEVMQQVRPFIKSCQELAATGLAFSIEK